MEGQRRSRICFFLWWSSLIGICEGIRVELIVRGEALGFVEDELLRNHLPRTVVIDQERKLERELVKRPPRELCPSGKTLVEACSDTDVQIVR